MPRVRAPQPWVETARLAPPGAPQVLFEAIGGVLHHGSQCVVETVLLVVGEDAVAGLRQPPDREDVEPAHRVGRELLGQIGACQVTTMIRARSTGHAAYTSSRMKTGCFGTIGEQLLVGRGCARAVEEHADLGLPPLEVGAQDFHLVGIRDLRATRC